MASRNVAVLLGAIVAIALCIAGVTCALCMTTSPTDHTPVVSSVLLSLGTALAALVALVKAAMNSQDQQLSSKELKTNTELTQTLGNKVENVEHLVSNRTDQLSRQLEEKTGQLADAKQTIRDDRQDRHDAIVRGQATPSAEGKSNASSPSK